MLEWITGSHGGETGANGEETFIDAPETPAPVFAVRAFKHALFGTPKPREATPEPVLPGRNSSKSSKSSRIQTLDDRGSRPEPTRSKGNESPVKPASILMTPGTINGRRKNVAFGKEVVDNEGKNRIQARGKSRNAAQNDGNISRLPDMPGRFPSPFTPKEKQMLDSNGASSLTAHVAQRIDPFRGSVVHASAAPRTKDDADITLDLMEPRSESGRYWKELHVSYAQQSEKQVKKLIAKHKLAKSFAKLMDAEVTELKVKFEKERKRHAAKEAEWGEQMKDMKERLRKAMAENSKQATELAVLRQQLEAGDKRKPVVDTNEKGETQHSTLNARLEALRPTKAPETRITSGANRAVDRNASTVPEAITPKPTSASERGNVSKRNPLATKQPTTEPATLPSPSSLCSPAAPPPDDTNPLSSPTSSLRPPRSSNSYRVSKRPITVTTARARTPLTTSPRRVKRSSPTKPPSAAKRVVKNDADIRPAATPNKTTSANITAPATTQSRAPTAPASTVPQPDFDPDWNLAAQFPELLTKSEKRQREGRHFPGSPAVSKSGVRVPLGDAPAAANVGAGTAVAANVTALRSRSEPRGGGAGGAGADKRTESDAERMASAKQRVAARRALKQGAHGGAGVLADQENASR